MSVRWYVNATCSAIMALSTLLNLIAGTTVVAGFCFAVSAYTAALALLEWKLTR